MRRTIGPFNTGDVLLAGGFAVAAAVEAAIRFDDNLGALFFGLGGAVAMAVLLVRRRHPLLAMTLFCGAGAAGTWVQARMLDSPDDSFVPVLALFVLSFALGAYAEARAVLWGAPQPVFLVVFVDLLEPGQGLVGATVFVSVFVVALPVAAGRLVRSRRRLLLELRRLEDAAALEHHQRLRRVRAEESVRVVGQLNETLEVGLEAILGADSIEDVEQQARRLLVLTRDAVVGLSRDEDPGPEPTANRARLRHGEVAEPSAQTWTLLVAAGIGAGLLTETAGSWHHTALGLVLAAGLVGAVVSIARHPLEGALLAWAAAVLLSRAVVPLGNTLTGIGLVVALPFLTAWLGTRPRAIIAVLGGLLAGVLGVQMSDPLGAVVLTGLASVAGGILRDRSALLAELRDARELAARRRRDELRTASLEQRASLGRELHDSIGHSLTVVALQAGAARRLQLSEPAAAAGARDTIEATARQALHDLRHGFDTGPGSISGLLDTARAAGLTVEVSGPLPPPDLAPIVYRILQEALTNVLRHAPGATAEIRLSAQTGVCPAYGCTVTNNSVPGEPARTFPSAGRGLSGMRARVEEIGGDVQWGPSGGGFMVTTRIPTSVEVAP